MRFHVVGLPHTATNREHSHCAYTQKVRNFCRMMSSLGHIVIHYGAEGSQVEGEHVTIITREEQLGYFGERKPDQLYAAKFDANEPYWQMMNTRAAEQIQRRMEKRDFLCLIGGWCQKQIVDLVGEADCIPVEYGIGYYGTFARFRVFESYTHQSAVYGTQCREPDGFFYDSVIPNSFDPQEFPYHEGPRSNCLLYMARLNVRKGILTAIEIAKASGVPLVIAGQGAANVTGNLLTTEEGYVIELSDDVRYIGAVGPARRATLLSNAVALLQPTTFLEPFGGNVVEAAMCGTPAITSDWGAFSETVKHGVTGYRCHTLEQFVWAVAAAKDLDHNLIHQTAVANYSIDRVRCMYQEYFEMLSGLWGGGWFERKRRDQLDWLRKV